MPRAAGVAFALLALAARSSTALPHGLAGAPAPAPPCTTAECVQAAAKRAFDYAHSHITTEYGCGWTRGTYMIGLWEYYNLTKDEAAKGYLQSWGEHYKYKLCAESTHHHKHPPPPLPLSQSHHRRRLQGACEQDVLPCTGVHNANNQLCGATYIELYRAGLDTPKSSNSTLADTIAVFEEEIAHKTSTNFWSWVDAAFMAMNTWARLGATTGDVKYFEKQWANFNAAMLLPANGDGGHKGTTFGFWNTTQHLFYRDDRYVHTEIYWGRGNGWAMGALVAAIQNGQNDPHRAEYITIFKEHAAKLASIISTDPAGRGGYWHSSLLNATGYPTPEMTGTASFVFGITYGINAGILDAEEFGPVVKEAWKFMSSTALAPNGLFGYCQPVGGSPEHNINANSTSDFCVGQFLLAATQVAINSAGPNSCFA